MAHVSCTRPDTTEPWSALAMFPELFYQHRAGRFSEGREQHIACHTSQLSLVHVSVSISATELGIQPWSPGFWLKTCCYCPTGVLGLDDGKTRLQIWSAFQKHQPSTWTPKPVGSQRRCNIENFHSPVNSHTLCDKHNEPETVTLLSVLPHPPVSSKCLSFSASNSASPAPGSNA